MADAEESISEVQKKLTRLKKLEDIRSDTIATCKEITEYILPRRGKYLSLGQTAEQKKSNKYAKIIKNTAARAHRVLKAGMHTGLTNQTRPWFRLKLADRSLMEYGPVSMWLDTTRDILLDILAGSNFYETAYSFYGEESGFGTACMYIEEDFWDVVWFRLFNMGEYCIACNEKGRVNTVYRRFYMTVGQVYERWPKTCSQRVADMAKKASSMDEKIQVVHVMEPRTNYDTTKRDKTNMPWKSCYIEFDGHDNKFLSEGGYQEFPCACARWEVVESDEYGDSPGMEILPDVKELQEVEMSSVKAIHKMVDPPLLAPATFKNRFKNYPGSVTFADINKDEVIGELYKVQFDVQSAEAKVQEICRDIKEAMFNDLFMMIANMEGTQPLTATEVLERREEKMTMLGPVVERNISEFLAPVIERTFAIANRAGRIPAPPPELNGVPVRIELISMLAQALKLVGTQSIQATVNFALGLAQVKPDIVDVVDFDESVQKYADFVGLPTKIIRSDDEIAKLRQARMQQQQEMAQRQAIGETLEGAKTASEIDTEGKNALTDVMKAAGGQA